MKMEYDAATEEHYLEIKDATMEDFGEYSVKATNTIGEAKCSFKVMLIEEENTETFKPSKPAIEMKPTMSVKAGGTVKMSCLVTGMDDL